VSFESEPFLTDSGLHILTSSLTQLKLLHLYSCIQVTGTGLRSAHTLKVLVLGQLPWFTGSALVYLARLPDLEYLSVIGWPPLSDAIVERLLKTSSKSLDMTMFGSAPHLTRRVLECHAKLGSRQHLWFRSKSFLLHYLALRTLLLFWKGPVLLTFAARHFLGRSVSSPSMAFSIIEL
jgi:hypothetical protein